MKWILTILGFALYFNLFAQHSLIYDVPNTPELLKKNKIKEIHIREKTEEAFKLTNKYLIKDGQAIEHHYFDPYFMQNGSVIEKSWLAKDSIGWVYYTRDILDENGKFITRTHRSRSHYSKTKKLLFNEQYLWTDYLTIRRISFDTLHPNHENREEIQFFNDDTLFWTKDNFNGTEENHVFKVKIGGNWQENERTQSVFENGVLIEYYKYSFGKLVDSYNKYEADKMIEKKGTDDLGYEDNGLPVPDPLTEIFYVDDLNVETVKEVHKKKAKFRLEIYYFQGKNSDPEYTFYDNKTGLVHTKFGKDKMGYTEFLYIME